MANIKHQDFGKVPYYQRHLKDTIPFNPKKQYAVIRCSICTGEQVAVFKSIEDEIYNIETVKKEY